MATTHKSCLTPATGAALALSLAHRSLAAPTLSILQSHQPLLQRPAHILKKTEGMRSRPGGAGHLTGTYTTHVVGSLGLC